MGYPQIIHFSDFGGILPYKPAILGLPICAMQVNAPSGRSPGDWSSRQDRGPAMSPCRVHPFYGDNKVSNLFSNVQQIFHESQLQ